jgi:hypothetical protein
MSLSSAIPLGGKPEIAYQLLGDSSIDSSIITNYDDYQLIYHKRHDLIHAAVCDKLQIAFGERTVEDVLQSHSIMTSTIKYYEEVKRQTPDYLNVRNMEIDIIEITVSIDPRAKNKKYAKYALLCSVLERAGFSLNYKIFVFNPRNMFINRSEMLSNGLDDLTLDFAKKVCDNAQKLLRETHRTRDGQLYYSTFYNIQDTPSKLLFNQDDVVRTHQEFSAKVFHSDDDLKSVLFEPSRINIDDHDEKFLTQCLELCKTSRSEMMSIEKFDEPDFIGQLKMMSNTNAYRSSLPMSFISPKTIDSSQRSTTTDWDNVHMIASKMRSSNDPTLSRIGDCCAQHLNSIRNKDFKNEDFLFRCKLSADEERAIALDGPGRKKYMRQGSEDHIKMNEKHNNYSLDPSVDVSDIEKISFYLSQRNQIVETGDINVDSQKLSNATGNGLNYVLLCQTIFREININAMRGDRRHNFIIKPTGAHGVYICLYPGTKLRCGELSNIVWYKIIIDNDVEDRSMMYSGHWIFKKLYRDSMVSHSKWLSCDVHRLDHYIRCYDKILMSYCAILSQKFKSKCDLSKESDEKMMMKLLV